jgi:hypothetical protein
MKARRVQMFLLVSLLCVPVMSIFPELTVGQIYGLSLVDVDGHNFSTTDGHVTVVVLTTYSDIDKARTVGDRVPEYCLGDPTYRMITVLNFQKKRSKPVRMILGALVRRRLDAEAQRLQPRYSAKKIAHDPLAMFLRSRILMARWLSNLALVSKPAIFASSFSAGTGNYCNSGTMCRPPRNWPRL